MTHHSAARYILTAAILIVWYSAGTACAAAPLSVTAQGTETAVPASQTHPSGDVPANTATSPHPTPYVYVTQTPTSLPPGVGSEGIGDPYYPRLGNGGYDVQKYTILLDVDIESGQVLGVTRLDALATQELTSFNLDFTGLKVDSVRVNGLEAGFTPANRELVVTPTQGLPDGSPFTVEVAYHGNPGHIPSQADDWEVGWFRASDGGVNTFDEPDGASTWFPCNNHPRDKAFYRFEITLDDPWVAAANGSLVDRIAQDGRTTYIFEMNEPMATYLATLNIDQYDLETMPGPDGVLIRNYFPSGFPETLRRNFDALPEVMQFLIGLYGAYPSAEYGFLIQDVDASTCADDPFADENQGLNTTCPAPSSTGVNTMVHEMTHEWFGDLVSLENWQDLWLKEGIATYTECLWDTRGEDVEAVSACMRDMASDYETRHPVDRPPRYDIFCGEAYTGAALVFHSLRLEVGDEVFFHILRTYLDRYRGSTAGTDDFIAVVNEVSGRDLEAKIRAWLQDPPVP